MKTSPQAAEAVPQSCGDVVGFLFVGFFCFKGFAGFHGIVIRRGFFILILIPAFRHGILIVLAGASLAAVIFFCRGFLGFCFFVLCGGFRFAVSVAPALWFLIVGYFLVLFVFGAFCGFPAVLCLLLMFGGSGGFEFFFSFFQRLLNQPDDEFLLGEAAVIGFLVAVKVFLHPLEQFLAYLKC